MRVVVCGGRDFDDLGFVWSELDAIHASDGPITLVIHGAATGADDLARRWAEDNNIPTDPHPADWSDIHAPGAVVKTNRFGKPYNALAGFWRNQKMADLEPDLVIAFPGEEGTKDMVRRAKIGSIRVIKVEQA